MDPVIVHELPEGESRNEFTVGRDQHLTLVLVGKHVTKIQAAITVRLLASRARATIIGIVIATDEANIRLHTLQQHEAPDTTSNLLVKSVLCGRARCVIDGAIRVEKNAQKTDAYQRNENLLLSDRAYAESKPSLEILANDVRCTHGATVGPISEEEIWYMATRGIGKIHAEKLIAAGFLRSALDLVHDERVRYRILDEVEDVLD